MSTLAHRVEALLVAASGPIPEEDIAQALKGSDLREIWSELEAFWARRGMRLVRKSGMVSLSPAPDVADYLHASSHRNRKLSDAAVETLSFIALNQPVTLADIEKGRGVKLFRGLMESLIDAELVRTSVRRKDSGRAVTYQTTEAFLERFGLTALDDLPTPDELSDIVGLLPDSDGE